MARKSPKKSAAKALTLSPAILRSEALGEALAVAREAGTPWAAKSGDSILSLTGAASAIPLRVPLRAYLASLSDEALAERFPREGAKIRSERAKGAKANAETARRLRDDEGAGFPLIAVKLGVSENEARDLYAKAGGLSADGRVYVNRAGQRTLVLRPGESVRPDDEAAAKAAKKAAKAARKAKAAKAAKRARKAA